MTKREAKRIVYGAVAALISNGQENGFIVEDDQGNDRPEPDQRRLQEALDELAAELDRRAGNG